LLALLAAVAVTQLAEAEGRNLTVLTINVWSGLGYRGYLKMGEHEPRTVREQRTRLLIEQLARGCALPGQGWCCTGPPPASTPPTITGCSPKSKSTEPSESATEAPHGAKPAPAL
jgi:hypothetical protein